MKVVGYEIKLIKILNNGKKIVTRKGKCYNLCE